MVKISSNLSIVILIIPWICLVSSAVLEHKLNAHNHMSEQELKRVFQVEHHADVPHYEVVNIHSVIRQRRKRRSPDDNDDDEDEFVHRVNLRTHGRDFDLKLQRNRHLIKRSLNKGFWFADSEYEGSPNVTYTPQDDSDEDIGEPYQDQEKRAALLLFKDKTDKAFLMDGMISEDLVVKPLSYDLRKLISSDESVNRRFGPLSDDISDDELIGNELLHDDYAFLDESDNLEDEDVMPSQGRRGKRSADVRLESGFHVVFKRNDVGKEHRSDYDFMEEEEGVFSTIDSGIKAKATHSRKKRQAPYIIFPEILCIVDYDGYRLHGKDNLAIKRYVISFWNGIDLRYKLLKGPSVKISIAGIIISRGRDATPYLERNRVGRDAIDSASALTDMGKYLFLERRLPVYDIAVAITKLDMCRRKSRHGECNRGTAGFAYVGGACVVNKRLEKVNSVAIVEDTGGFSGIIVAAHELGHLLGAVHDGSPPPSYLGGPGARKCRWEDGFIMSDLRHTSKGFRWSRCTIKQFHHFLNGETATCMYNSPHADESLPRVLPGKLLTLDAQCRKDRGTSACFKDERVCAQLFCFDAGSGYCVSYRPAAEGSRCGDGKMCLNGKCVYEHENSVDFDSDGFVRRSGSVSYKESPSLRSTSTMRWRTTTTTESPPSSSLKTSRLPWWKRIPRTTPKPTTTPSTTSTTIPSTEPPTTIVEEDIPDTTTTTTTTPKSTTTKSTTTRKPPSRSTTTRSRRVIQRLRAVTKSKKEGNKANSLTKGDDDTSDKCEDRINNIAGSMSCKAFLRSFAYQYCRHKYIKKNCCASHKIYCTGGRRGRSFIHRSTTTISSSTTSSSTTTSAESTTS